MPLFHSRGTGFIADSFLQTQSSRLIAQDLPRGVDRMCLDSRMTCALIVLGEGFQSTPGNQALMQDPFSFKV